MTKPPEPYSGPDRRLHDRGPPDGIERRRSVIPEYVNRITLGSIIQTATIALSVIGAAVTAIFASGAYVQHLRDDLAVAENKAVEREVSNDKRVIDLLEKLAATQSAKARDK